MSIMRRGIMSLHLDHLNPEQLAAVTAPDEHALILAGAGSGKTRVLTHPHRLAGEGRAGHAGASSPSPSPTRRRARCCTRVRRCSRPIRAACGSAPSTACATACCARTTATPGCRRRSRSSTRRTSSRRSSGCEGARRRRGPLPAARDPVLHRPATRKSGVRAGEVPISDDTAPPCVEFYAAYDEQCEKEGVVDFPEMLLRSYEL